MIAYIIYNKLESERNAWFINELIKESKTKDIELILLLEENIQLIIDNNPSLIYKNHYIKLPKFVINRTNNYIISLHFELMGIKVFNNSNVSHFSNNKYLAYLKMSSINVPVLETKLLDFDNIYTEYQYPVVIKPVDGKGGRDVFLCNNENELLQNAKKINLKYFIVQEYANNPGKDLRVYIIGNTIYKSVLRVSNDGFISNYCLGNNAILYELNEKEIKLINLILSSETFDYVGIDFLFHNNEIIFNEIEDAVGARMLYDKTNLNVAHDLIEYISSTVL